MKNKIDYRDWDESLFISQVEHLYKDLEIHEFYRRIKKYDLDVLYENNNHINLAFILSFMDYICNIHPTLKLPQNYARFDDFKLSEPWYQKGMDIYISVTGDFKFKKECYDNAIPEFKERNIIITDIKEAI